jgi:tetratricopeptide (TPR) repeat protein
LENLPFICTQISVKNCLPGVAATLSKSVALVRTAKQSSRHAHKQPLKNLLHLWHIRFLIPATLVCAAGLLYADESLPVLRRQLEAAETANDNPAIVELSRRIVEADPKDSKTWEALARKQLELNDEDRCAATLDAWQARVHPKAKVIDDIRGDLASARKDYKLAEQYWRSYIIAAPEAADTLEKLAKLSESAGRWQEATEFRSRLLGQDKTAPGLIARANDYVELRAWDKAFADVARANTIDPSDAAVKESLPRFELLKKFLPRIRSLDMQIAKAPDAIALWLDRAHLFTLSERPNLALEDCEHVMKLAPGRMRARIQTGEALLDLGRVEDAAKLSVSYDLQRDSHKHVSDEALRALNSADEMVLNHPDTAEPHVIRAKVLRMLRQYILALADERIALQLDPGSTAAHLEAASTLASLGRTREALAHAERATSLNPQDPVAWYYRGLLAAKRANFDSAIRYQTRSLAIRESAEALLERERCARRLGRIAEADVDAQRRKQLSVPQQ